MTTFQKLAAESLLGVGLAGETLLAARTMIVHPSFFGTDFSMLLVTNMRYALLPSKKLAKLEPAVFPIQLGFRIDIVPEGSHGTFTGNYHEEHSWVAWYGTDPKAPNTIAGKILGYKNYYEDIRSLLESGVNVQLHGVRMRPEQIRFSGTGIGIVFTI